MERHARCLRLPLFAVLAILFGAPLEAQTGALMAEAEEGRDLFLRNCAHCHGGDATGGRGPNLAMGLYRRATTDARFIDIVQNGIDGTGMPWTGLSEANATKVVTYLRSLGGGEVELPGDPVRGRELFFGTGTCSTCHMVAGEGSRQGPDLSSIGWQRAADHIRQSILEPNTEVDPRWWTAEVELGSGETVAGVLVDEDQFAVRLLDGEDALHSFAKRDLARFDRVKTSMMPSMRGTLSDSDVEDLVAFLADQRGGVR